jgi:hypothetical protein
MVKEVDRYKAVDRRETVDRRELRRVIFDRERAYAALK